MTRLARIALSLLFLALAPLAVSAQQFQIPSETQISAAFSAKCVPNGQHKPKCEIEGFRHWHLLQMMSLCDALAKAHRGLDDPEGASKQEVRCGELRISARVAMEFFGFPIKAANE